MKYKFQIDPFLKGMMIGLAAVIIAITIARCTNTPETETVAVDSVYMRSTGEAITYGKVIQSVDKPIRDTFKNVIRDTYKRIVTVTYDSTVIVGVYTGTTPPVDPPVEPPVGDYGTVIYDNDYGQSSDINKNQLGEGGFSTVDGKGAFRSVVTGKVETSSSYRSEQQFDGSQYNPNEFVVEYQAKYENWKNFGSNTGHVVQWHPHGDGLSATLSIYGYEGQFEVVRNISGTNYRDGKYSAGKRSIQSNVWITHRWEIKWSTGNDGYIRLYLGNVLYYSFTGKTKFESENPYFKLGQNRWVVSGGTSTVYYRNLKIWKR